jgi:hypothetical protein
VTAFTLPEDVKVEMKQGDTVDASHWDYTSDEDAVHLRTGDLIASLDERIVYRYLGADVEETDLSAADFATADWEEALSWKFTIAADELEVPDGTLVNNDGEVYVNEGTLVALADDGLVYRFLGSRELMDLTAEDFTDTDRWVQELARGYVFSGLTDLATADFTDTEIWQRSKVHTVDPAAIDTAAIRLKEGDLVDLSTATQERVYRYLGDGATVYLGQTDLTDTGLWKVELLRRELVKAEAEAEAEATSGNPTANPTSTHVNLKTGQLVLTSTPNGG